MKWCLLLTLIGMAGTFCGGLVSGFVDVFLGIYIPGDGLGSLFTLGFLIAAAAKEIKKRKARRGPVEKMPKEEAEGKISYINKASEKNRREKKEPPKAVEKTETINFAGNPISQKLDSCGVVLGKQAERVSNSATAAVIRSISSTMRKIAVNVDEDPRDRGKVRGLSDTCSDLVEGLVSKYINLEKQNQESENIKEAQHQIELALSSTDQALKRLLDDLFANDNVEIATEVAILDKMLEASSPENVLKM